MGILSASVWAEIRLVFAKAFPHEAVVAVWGDEWEELANVDPKPMFGFSISDADRMRLLSKPPTLFLHSHPHGSAEPSDMDTIQQLSTGWNWGIVAVKGSEQGQLFGVEYPECWGPNITREPLVGRSYLWGIRDCWTLCRDWYLDNGWQIDATPRAKSPSIYPVGHWGNDMFSYFPPKLGFKEVKRHERKHGDLAIMQLRSDRKNHCAIYLGEGRFLHQLEDAGSLSGYWTTDNEERLIERMNIEFHRPPKKRSTGK